jgi:SAM-dependent methyltransferase
VIEREGSSQDGGVAHDWERLRTTFDTVAELYQQARPEYPEPLYDTLVDLTGVGAGNRVVEVGCATGKATLPLAGRGLRITCVEIGPGLASVARQNLSALPNVEVIEGAFETWQPPDSVRFDLVFAATAWHWIDPAVRYRRAWELLRPGGHLAFWSATHVFPDDGDPFFAEIQDIYDEIGEALPPGASRLRPGALPDDRAEIEHSGLFRDVITRDFDWEISYTADEYLRLLDTFSGHIAMHPWQRDRLYPEIRRRLAQRPDGRLRRGWGAVLHVARRTGPEPTS